MKVLLGVSTGIIVTAAGFHASAPVQQGATEQPTFTHVALVVDDMELMRDFYTRVLGLDEVRHVSVEDSRVSPPGPGAMRVTGFDSLLNLRGVKLEAAFYRDAGGRQFLELMKLPAHPAPPVERALDRPLGLNHIGMRVSGLSRILETMASEGLGAVLGGPVTIPEFGGATAVFITDPEGNIVELSEPARP